jgi:hypothetical protein
MAVQLDVISVIIPIRNIEKHYPGGFEQYKKDHSSQIGGNDMDNYSDYENDDF